MDEEFRSRETQEAVDRRMESPQATAVEKVLAVIEGAAEGFAEQSRKARLPETAGRAVAAASESAQEVRHAVGETAPRSGDGGPNGAASPPPEPGAAAKKAAGRAEQLASAAGQAAHRAAEAPAAIAHEVRSAARQAGRDARNALLGVVGAGFLAAAAILFLAHALAIWLNLVLGAPWGTAVVAVLFAIGGAVAWFAAKAALRDAGQEFQGTIRTVKQEVRRVGEPLREATKGRGAT